MHDIALSWYLLEPNPDPGVYANQKEKNSGSKAYRWHFGLVNYSLDTSLSSLFVFDWLLLFYVGNFLSFHYWSFVLAGGVDRFRRWWGLSSTIASGVWKVGSYGIRSWVGHTNAEMVPIDSDIGGVYHLML